MYQSLFMTSNLNVCVCVYTLLPAPTTQEREISPTTAQHQHGRPIRFDWKRWRLLNYDDIPNASAHVARATKLHKHCAATLTERELYRSICSRRGSWGPMPCAA